MNVAALAPELQLEVEGCNHSLRVEEGTGGGYTGGLRKKDCSIDGAEPDLSAETVGTHLGPG